MAKTGPIVLLEDDADDHGVLADILNELNIQNKLVWFTNDTDAF